MKKDNEGGRRFLEQCKIVVCSRRSQYQTLDSTRFTNNILICRRRCWFSFSINFWLPFFCEYRTMDALERLFSLDRNQSIRSFSHKSHLLCVCLSTLYHVSFIFLSCTFWRLLTKSKGIFTNIVRKNSTIDLHQFLYCVNFWWVANKL